MESILKGGGMEQCGLVLITKKTWPQSALCSHVEYPSRIHDKAFRFVPKTKSQPSAEGSIWKGGAAAWARSDFCKKSRSKLYIACSDMEHQNTMDAGPDMTHLLHGHPPGPYGLRRSQRLKKYNFCSESPFPLLPLRRLGIGWFCWS